MLRTSKPIDLNPYFHQLLAVGDGAPSLNDKVALSQAIRAESQDAGTQLDRFFVSELSRLQSALVQIENTQSNLREALERLKGTPWHPATFLGIVRIGAAEAALVSIGNTRRAVAVSNEVDLTGIGIGDDVLLGQEANLLVGMANGASRKQGETAVFERLLPDDRIVLKCRDEEFVVATGEGLHALELKNGDLIRWDRETWLALEKIDRSEGTDRFLESTPTETFDQIGGLDGEIRTLLRSLRLHAFHQETVGKYGLPPKKSVLLVGPPGNGKTMVARALANWLATQSESGRARFMNIKPSALHSMWYGMSEAQYRECFRVAREAGEKDPATPTVMFFDEIDAVGTARGSSILRANDQVLAALLAELDGLEKRGNVLVVAATNRRDALDPALLRPGRLGDLILEIPRPNRSGAHAILQKYLSPQIPYWTNGHANMAAARVEIIESALARMYSATGESDLATIAFRDGKRRTILMRDVVSGAAITNIAHDAIERACAREVEGGEAGVQLGDLLDAIHDEFDRAARSLTTASCHRYLTNLPQDVDIVAVEPIARKPCAPHRYMRTL